MSESKNFWVYIETEHGKAKNASYELITAAKPLAEKRGGTVVAVVVGAGVEAAAKDAICYGADSAILVDAPIFDCYSTDAQTKALAALAEKYGPEALLLAGTNNGKDLAPRLAGRLKTGLASDCIAAAIDEDSGSVAWTRPTMGGNLMAVAVCPVDRPQMATVRPGAFKRGAYDEGRAGEIVKEDVPVSQEDVRVTLKDRVSEVAEAVNLEEAEIIVSGGRGVGSAENFRIIEELAAELGATVGCSRAVVDAGWLPHAHQVGQSGKSVAPRIYFAIGISGAVQHLAGISGSDTIIAVNKDEDAPIFEVADYGIVGNLNEVVPALTAAFKAHKA